MIDLPQGKMDLLQSLPDVFDTIWETMNATLEVVDDAPLFKRRLGEALDLKRYTGATSWAGFCSCCGLCCADIKANAQLFDFLLDDNGDCRNFCKTDGLCRIYHERPLPCRVDDLYDAVFAPRGIARDRYYAFQAACCTLRQHMAGKLK